MDDDASFFASINRLSRALYGIQQRAEREYGPLDDEIIRTGNTDADSIEHILDRLLDFCDDLPIAELHQRLCRHYEKTDPMAADIMSAPGTKNLMEDDNEASDHGYANSDQE